MPLTSRPTIVEQLHRSFDQLTGAEKKVARALIARYPAAGLAGVSELAKESKTSTASVVRLVQKIGYEGFATFQAVVLSELAARDSGPQERLTKMVDPEIGILAGLTSSLAEKVATIADTVPTAEYEAAVKLLANPKLRISLAGGRVSQSWAETFATYLSRIRRDVTVLSRDTSRRAASLLDLSAKSVIVAFDFRRYDAATVRLAKEASARNAKVILITDLWLSPAASDADIVLPVAVEGPSPFDTSITSLALVECLTWSTVQRLGAKGAQRMLEWDALASPPN